MDWVSSSSLAARERCSLGRELNRDYMAGSRRFCKLPALRDRNRRACICETCRIEDQAARAGLAAEVMLVPDHGRCRNRWARPTVGRGHNGVNVSPWRRTSEVGMASLRTAQHSTAGNCRGAAPLPAAFACAGSWSGAPLLV